MIGWLFAILALFTQPTTPPDAFILDALTRGTPLVVTYEGAFSFAGLVWPCDPADEGKDSGDYEGEQCYAGLVAQDGAYVLETGP